MSSPFALTGGHPVRAARWSAVLGSAVAGLVMLVAAAVAAAGPTDTSYPPTTSGGHDFNHAPIGQSFKALAPSVTAGIHIADGVTFTNWLAIVYPGQITPGSYPYTPAPTLNVRVSLYDGEGMDGAVLHSTSLVVTAPFMGFLDVDYAAAGVLLEPGRMYTILLEDEGAGVYPQGVSGWVVSSVTDPGSGQPLPPGAYPDGLPILQGVLYTDDAGIGDNSFHVLDTGATPSPLAIATASLPTGRVGVAYAAAVEATGGLAPVTVEVVELPAGLVFDGAEIAGTPQVAGTFPLTVTATDSVGATATASLTLAIEPATSSYTVKVSGKGRITAVGPGLIKVGTKTILYDSTTVLILNYATSIEVGMRAQWKGLKNPNTGIIFATKLEIY